MGEVSIWTWILIGSAALIMAGTLIRLAIRIARVVLVIGAVIWISSFLLGLTEPGRELVENTRSNVVSKYERIVPWVQAQLEAGQ